MSDKLHNVQLQEQVIGRVVMEPLAEDEIKALLDEDGWATLVAPVPFDKILDCWGMDEFNDAVEEILLEHGVLSDISYKPVGVLPDGRILIETRAEFVIDD